MKVMPKDYVTKGLQISAIYNPVNEDIKVEYKSTPLLPTQTTIELSGDEYKQLGSPKHINCVIRKVT